MDGKLETGSDVPAEDRTRLNTRRVELGLEPFRGAFVGCRRWIKSVKILSDALMEDLKTATRKNEILF